MILRLWACSRRCAAAVVSTQGGVIQPSSELENCVQCVYYPNAVLSTTRVMSIQSIILE